MKQSTKTFAIFVSALFLVISLQLLSCKKSGTTNPTATPTPTPANYVCTGNAATNYMPLTLGNKWEYSGLGTMSYTNEVIGSLTMGGKSYSKVHYSDQVTNFDDYYRMATNGDIYKYYELDLAEYLYLPVNPTLNQVIATYVSGASRKVTGVNVSLTTSSCTYSGLIKIEDLFKDGTNESTQYYKKGLGMVQEIVLAPTKSSLNAVTLK